MIRVRLMVARILPAQADGADDSRDVQVDVTAYLDPDRMSYQKVRELVRAANEGEGKIHVVGYRDVKMPSAGEEEEIVKAEIWGGSFLLFEAAARKLGADAGHPFLVLCQAARELGAVGSRPLHFSVEVA